MSDPATDQDSSVPPQQEDDWRITIDVPMSLPDSERERLFTAVADVVHGWEPVDREGWDAFVVAGAEDHSAEAHAERVSADLARLRQHLSASDGAEREWHNLATNGVTASAKWKGERDTLSLMLRAMARRTRRFRLLMNVNYREVCDAKDVIDGLIAERDALKSRLLGGETERPRRCPALLPEGNVITEGRQCQQYEGHPHDHTWYGDNGHAYSAWAVTS